MNPPEPPEHDHEGQQRLEEVLAAYMQRIDRGEQVDREAFVAEHPELADELRAYFAAADQV
jgi:2-oxo-4-hydroxy-4-carboxy--5-ureidoimidazoline (OHCU) decarboxylase